MHERNLPPMQKPFSPRRDPRPEMEKALEKAIRLSTTNKYYYVTDGRFVYEEHRRYRYTFLLASSSWDLPDGTDLQLSSSDFDHPLSVQLLHTKDDTVTIVTAQRLPERTLTSAQLVVDRAFMLRKMKDALSLIPTSAQLGLKLFGHMDCSDEVVAHSSVEWKSNAFVPDNAQHLALQRALASELLMILGPPGTGKTGVLAAIALLHARRYKHRMLIVSHTNIAIDNAMIRLVGFLKEQGQESWLEEQNVIRHGTPHLAELETDAYRNVTLPLIVTDVIEHQRDEIALLESKRKVVLDQMAQDQAAIVREEQAWQQRKNVIPQERYQALTDLEQLEKEENRHLAIIQTQLARLREKEMQTQEQIKQISEIINRNTTQLQPLLQKQQHQLERRKNIEEKLKRLRTHKQSTRFFIQLFTGEWEYALEENLSFVTKQLENLMQQIAPIQRHQDSARHTYKSLEQTHEEVKVSITTWTKEHDLHSNHYKQEKAALHQKLAELDQEMHIGNPRISELQKTIQQEQLEISLTEDLLARLDQHIVETKREVAHRVVESAQIVGVTLTAFYMNPLLLSQEWDVIIIDEGSMAPPPAVLIAADRARSHVIVVGDPLQLAPVCKFQDDQVKQWLGRDVFFHGGYTLEQATEATHHSILLPYQGRMHTQISDLIRQPIYKGHLKDRTPHIFRQKIGPELDFPVVLYDTSESSSARAQHPDSGKSRYNAYHADIVVTLAWKALADIPPEKRVPECIGIVTPYAAQRDYIKKQVQGTELEALTRIGTVHAFQGLEFDALIFDTVESPGLKITRFISGGWNSDAMRLLNVAISRARDKLLIVANMTYIRQEPASSLLPQIMELAAQQRCISTTTLVV